MKGLIYPKRVWLNGRLMDPRRPMISLFDRGFLYGDGVYETIRIYDGKMFHFGEHIKRLEGSARGVKIRIPFSRKKIQSGAEALIKANTLKEATVRITLTRGEGPLGFDPRPCQSPTLSMIAVALTPHAERLYENGIRLAVSRVRRNSKLSLDPALKSTNNLNNILAKMEAIERNAYEALMLNVDGYLAEGTISNIFFLSRGRLRTPTLDCGLLAGVTRDAVLALSRRGGLNVEEGRYHLKDLLAADEAFITSTTLEVMPVTTVIDPRGRAHRIGSGEAGPWALRLRKDYLREVAQEIHRRK